MFSKMFNTVNDKQTTDALYMSISSSRWNPWIVALIRDHTIQELSFNRLSSLRMASEKSEFERVVITNRTYRKTIGESSTITM